MSTKTKENRPVRAIALASALALALCVPAAAFAAEVGSGTADATAATTARSTAATGTIKATTLTVTVPTKVAFYLDPGAAQSTVLSGTWPADTKFGQYTNPSNFTITNHSAVDVYGYVSKVESPHVTLVNDQTLQKDGGVAPSAATKARTKVMVGICDTTESMALGTASDWMTESVGDTAATRYYAFNKAGHGKLAAALDSKGSVDNSRSDAKGEYTMTIRGAVYQGGWSESENFLIKPVVKIVTTDPSK